jgi:hypothetical protein
MHLASFVQESCGVLGRPRDAEAHIRYLHDQWFSEVEELRELSEDQWRQLMLPLKLKWELQRRLALSAGVAGALSTGETSIDEFSGRLGTDESDAALRRRAPCRWTLLILGLVATSAMRCLEDLLHEHPVSQGAVRLALAAFVEATAESAARSYGIVEQELCAVHAKRSLRDALVWRCCVNSGFQGRPRTNRALQEAFGRDFNESLGSKLCNTYNQLVRSGVLLEAQSKRGRRKAKSKVVVTPASGPEPRRIELVAHSGWNLRTSHGSIDVGSQPRLVVTITEGVALLSHSDAEDGSTALVAAETSDECWRTVAGYFNSGGDEGPATPPNTASSSVTACALRPLVRADAGAAEDTRL